tara:strand:+ start:512 stop:778 length:267 start_codon:yes stop_codon:yes gene_type:complete
MSIETLKDDLIYYKPLMEMCESLRRHVYVKTFKCNFDSTKKRFEMQKDYGITNFATFIVVEFMRCTKYFNLPKEEKIAIDSYTTRRLQ